MKTDFILIQAGITILATLNVFFPLPGRYFSFWAIPSCLLGWLFAEFAHYIFLPQILLSLLDFYSEGLIESKLFLFSVNLICFSFLIFRYQLIFRKVYLFRKKEFKKNEKKFFSYLIDSLLAPFKQLIDPKMRVLYDLPYAENKKLKLDLYLPRKKNLNQAPVLLQIHGGGWVIGGKHQAVPLLKRMSAKNWICISINYRHFPSVNLTGELEDCLTAVNWIKEHISNYGGDFNNLTVTGGSSGAHLASLLIFKLNQQTKFRIKKAVLFYGIYDFLYSGTKNGFYPLMFSLQRLVTKQKNKHEFSPVYWIRNNKIPFFLIHGTGDSLVPFQESERFFKELELSNLGKNKFIKLPFTQHLFDFFPGFTTILVLNLIEDFLINQKKA